MERFDSGALKINPIHRDAPLLRLVKAGEQADDAGFSRAGRADQRNGLAGFRLETNVFENPRVRRRGVVAEVNMVEDDVAAHGRQCGGTGPVLDLRLGIKQLKNALGAGGGREHGVVEVTHGLDGAEEHAQVKNERGEFADCDRALGDERSAVAEHDGCAET